MSLHPTILPSGMQHHGLRIQCATHARHCPSASSSTGGLHPLGNFSCWRHAQDSQSVWEWGNHLGSHEREVCAIGCHASTSLAKLPCLRCCSQYHADQLHACSGDPSISATHFWPRLYSHSCKRHFDLDGMQAAALPVAASTVLLPF